MSCQDDALCGKIPHRSTPMGECLEYSRRTHGEVTEPSPDGSKDCIADGWPDDSRRRFAKADWGLCAVNELNVELGHVADTQRRIGCRGSYPSPDL